MTFSEIALENIGFILIRYRFRIIEQRDDYLRLESNNFLIIIAYNQLERSCILWVGNKSNKTANVEIDNEILLAFFHSNLKLSQVPVEIFFHNLVLFFQKEADILFADDFRKMTKLLDFSLERSQKYTQELLLRQDLRHIDKAWSNGNYSEFVSLMDKIDKDRLPASYTLKYKIAQKKL